MPKGVQEVLKRLVIGVFLDDPLGNRYSASSKRLLVSM